MDLGHLNPPQRDAVTHGGGPLLVLAGAGSGKTRVITHRIAWLIERGVEPRHIAALTFTNKAAREMRGRVAQLLGSRKAASDLTMGTFHSLGLTVLKQEREALGFSRGFVIYDTADQLGVIREILRRVDTGDRRFDVKAILARISLAKNGGVAPTELAVNPSDEYDAIAAEVYPRYQEALRAFAAVDFDDLICEPVRLFEGDAGAGERWASAFRHVLVDEYQDTNRAQLRMIKHLTHRLGNVTAVGDDDQSIYSWRGADPSGILRFEEDFAGARVVVLDQNYRSTPTILAAANGVIGHNVERRGKRLWSEKRDGKRVIAAVTTEPIEEARFVAHEILRLVRDEGRRLADVAVLYRSNIQTRELEEELRARDVGYVMYGGQQFFERKEVKDLLAYLRVALADQDEISLRRVINYPARGIGATTLDRLVAFSRAQRIPLWAAVARAAEVPGLKGPALAALTGFAEQIGALRAALDGGGVVPAARQLIEAIDLIGDLRQAATSVTAAQRRIENVESILRSLARHEEKKPGKEALLEYLRHLSLAAGDDDDRREDGGDRVVLTTLHGAKGLEFPIVFLVGGEEELLPHARSLMPHATDVSDVDHVADVSEERRLAYVGITRAEEVLYVTRCAYRRSHGRLVPRTPSRFLLEIPDDLIEHRDISAEATAPVESGELVDFFQKLAGGLGVGRPS